ncbi:MAG: AbiH family protein [Bifidobacterium longum]|uniref:AbiH family protein n=1 Tax=Bacteria TaxID=2 RepID=UPI00178CFE4B|nr:AbiH family protein [Bifidobacterium longum]MCB5290277.1 bacteriophage abortive infection AbiH family protein [Bifidobacterium longum subsp. infantis]MCZ4462991.1 AbiH family protein [Bifidobacterium longum subsp. longum]MCZ4464901.1 AbiH family protein [Bifidobacterium longum subsp. longum]MDB6541427.1 AbiH family protein [Bifidobacterium longum]MDB6545472.1 AbiH family protein [Bifidobacterium longum]
MGNGFDLAQHIPSSYSAFFRDRYTKYRESFKKAIMPRVTYQVNVEDPCVWDYLFIAWHDTSKKLDDWKDVESAIKEWVIGKGSISLNDALNYWTILSVKPSRPDAVVNAYLKIQKYVNEHSSNIDFSVLNYFNTSADLDDEGSEDPVEILRVKLLDFFAKELHVIEDAFTRYLIRVQGNPSYDSSSRNIYKAMAETGTDIPLDEQSNVILSFNYTTPLLQSPREESIYYHRNVHGDVDRFSDESHGGYDYHVIFGIDGQAHMDEPGVYQFTKTARVLKLRRQYLTGEMAGRSIFDAQSNGSDIAEVKFFGHSLGEADYSYFQSLFDQIDLYGGETKLTFFGTLSYPANYDAIIRLMTEYGKTIVPEAHGRNLLHKLLLEDRLKIATFDTKIVA